MNDVVLTSGRETLLIDSALLAAAGETADPRALAATYALHLLRADGGGEPAAGGLFSRAFADDFAELERACASGELADTLIVSRRERLIAWARRHGLPVVAPEPEQSLGDALAPATLVVRDAAALIMRAKRLKEDRPLLIGINGISRAGKTDFAARLSEQLRDMGFNTVDLSLDLFIAQRKQRKARGYSDADLYYHKFFDLDRIHEQLLQPMFSGRASELRIDAYDLRRERVSETRVHELDRKTMVLLQGPFLFRREHFSAYDFRIYLVTDFERSLEIELADLEGRKRDKRRKEFTQRELAAHSAYLRLENPWKRAHLVVRGANTERPQVEAFRLDAMEDDADRTLEAFDL